MHQTDDFDEDDLFAIDQLLELDKNSTSLSKQTFSQNPIINPEDNQHGIFEISNSDPMPIRSTSFVPNDKPQKQSSLSNFFEAPEAKKTVKTQEIKQPKAQSTKKKNTSANGATRIDEYIQDSKAKREAIDYSSMTIEQFSEHFKDHQTKISKNSGCDPKTPINLKNAETWIYLMSKSFREYQFVMVETSLFYNTLVCLPTGLGKTFVAANVILNYYRWFPEGKIFFLAPTRPLVHQQKAAIDCLKSIDENDILELTGSVNAKKRRRFYIEKRVFFMTPQTIENDLANGLIDHEKIVLIILDEAHKALGKYAYVNVAKFMDQTNIGYRIVALTATPGNNEEKIQEVLENLNISRLEAKDENDDDVRPYIQSRDVKEVVIKETLVITEVNKIFNDIMMKPIKTLNSMQMFPAGSKFYITKPTEINRMKVLQILEEFNLKNEEYSMLIGPDNRSLFYELMGILMSLCTAKKALHEQGVQPFVESIQNFKSNLKNKYGNLMEYKKRMIDSPEFKKLEEYMKEIKNTGENHPKLKKLLEILSEFFRDKENIEKQSRIMIFTNNRSSANEICNFLQKDEMIKPSIFIGQGTNKTKTGKLINEGINQKKQIEILKKFKDYELNTLIATCIGEEGLDIGEIDLIICYDSGFSPVRLVQRMGRTGRKRAGKVIILLMEGRELFCYRSSVKRSQKLKDGIKANSVSKIEKKSIVKAKTNFRFYSFNPRMIPEEITPKLVFANEFKEEKIAEAQEMATDQILGENENSLFNIPEVNNTNSINDNQINEDSKGWTNIEEENEDNEEENLDYDQICALLEAQGEMDGSKIFDNKWPSKNELEQSNKVIDIEMEKHQEKNNKKTLKRKYQDEKENEPQIYPGKKVKFNNSQELKSENGSDIIHLSQGDINI